MRHRVFGKKFNRSASSRKALLLGLIKGVVAHGKINTTLPKAKFLRPELEKIITISRTNSLSARRLLIKKLGNKELAAKLIDDIGPLFIGRNGGYTRILKLMPRKGDFAKMAEISLVETKKVEPKVEAVESVEVKKPVVAKPKVAKKENKE